MRAERLKWIESAIIAKMEYEEKHHYLKKYD
jgi:hypothetical protein